MKLNMYIDGVLVDSTAVDFSHVKKSEQKQKYLEKLASELTAKHINRIMHTRFWPEYFLEEVPSKMNRKSG